MSAGRIYRWMMVAVAILPCVVIVPVARAHGQRTAVRGGEEIKRQERRLQVAREKTPAETGSVVNLVQRELALGDANGVRSARARLIAQLAAREIDAATLVRGPPECLRSMFVFDFLRKVPGINRGRLREINALAVRAGINLAVTLAELSPLKREWLSLVVADPGNAARVPPPLASRPQG